MARHLATPKFEDLTLSDDESPQKYANSSQSQRPKTLANSSIRQDSNGTTNTRPSSTDEETRDAELTGEFESLRRINTVIEGVVDSLERVKANMETITRTVTHASTLLDNWTRILSQTEHNQRLILNPAWQGATQDLANAENEALTRQRELERRDAEEAQRREVARLEEERRKAEAIARAAAGSVRGRADGRGLRGRRGRGYPDVGPGVGGSGRVEGRAPSSGYGVGAGRGGVARGRGRGLT